MLGEIIHPDRFDIDEHVERALEFSRSSAVPMAFSRAFDKVSDQIEVDNHYHIQLASRLLRHNFKEPYLDQYGVVYSLLMARGKRLLQIQDTQADLQYILNNDTLSDEYQEKAVTELMNDGMLVEMHYLLDVSRLTKEVLAMENEMVFGKVNNELVRWLSKHGLFFQKYHQNISDLYSVRHWVERHFREITHLDYVARLAG